MAALNVLSVVSLFAIIISNGTHVAVLIMLHLENYRTEKYYNLR